MSDPRRWRDDGDVPEPVRRLFARGTSTRAMPDRARSRLVRRIGRAAVAPFGATFILTWKSLAIAAGIGAATVATVATVVQVAQPNKPAAPRQREHPRSSPPVESMAPQSPPAALSAPSPRPETRATPPAVVRRLEAAPSDTVGAPDLAPPSAAAEDTLSREVALLERAGALFESSPESVLPVLDEHRRRFPHGKLSVERELLAIDTLKRLGRQPEARERAVRLLPTATGTIYEARVRGQLDDAR